MGLDRLRRSRRLETRPTAPDEIARLLESAGHYLKNVQVAGLEPTARFFVAYPAALDLAGVVLRASGYRLKSGKPGHPESTFEALEDLFGAGGPGLSKYFQKCRKLRNEVSYDNWIDMSDTEVDQFVEEVRRFKDPVSGWLKANHPSLLPEPPKGPPP